MSAFIVDCTFYNNSADFGGAVYSVPSLFSVDSVIQNSVFIENAARYSGRLFCWTYNQLVKLMLLNEGGAIYSATLSVGKTCTGCRFINNTAGIQYLRIAPLASLFNCNGRNR